MTSQKNVCEGGYSAEAFIRYECLTRQGVTSFGSAVTLGELKIAPVKK